jgi:hypothetical protein
MTPTVEEVDERVACPALADLIDLLLLQQQRCPRERPDIADVVAVRMGRRQPLDVVRPQPQLTEERRQRSRWEQRERTGSFTRGWERRLDSGVPQQIAPRVTDENACRDEVGRPPRIGAVAVKHVTIVHMHAAAWQDEHRHSDRSLRRSRMRRVLRCRPRRRGGRTRSGHPGPEGQESAPGGDETTQAKHRRTVARMWFCAHPPVLHRPGRVLLPCSAGTSGSTSLSTDGRLGDRVIIGPADLSAAPSRGNDRLRVAASAPRR